MRPLSPATRKKKTQISVERSAVVRLAEPALERDIGVPPFYPQDNVKRSSGS